MKAAVVTKYGGPEVLELLDVPLPRPAGNQVLVHVRAIGLNFADVFSRLGVYPGTPPAPFIPGLEFAGDVVAVGTEVTSFRGRERVMGYCRNGSHAEYVAVDQRYVVPLPSAMGYEEGSAFLAAYLTAYHGLVRLANIRPGEKVLVHAAAGGVGIATIQLARHLGAEVFGTAGTDEKVAFLKTMGADHAINYATEDFASRIQELTKGYGVDVVMDSVGGEAYRKSWQLLAHMGRYVLFGVSAVTGKGSLSRLKAAGVFSLMKPIFPPSLISANKGIFGFNLGSLTGKAAYFQDATTELLRMYERGALRPHVGRIFDFDDIVGAHRALQTRHSTGKVVVRLHL